MSKWAVIIPETAWVVRDVLTPEECQHFLQKARSAGIDERKAPGDVRHRDSMTVAVDDDELSVRVYERIADQLPQEVWVTEDCQNLGLRQSKESLYGKWKPYGLNTKWRIVCYPGHGHFGPHRDGNYQIDEHHRSLITLNGYLTDRPVGFGGATRFLKDDLDVYEKDGIFTTPEEAVLHRVEADKAGKAVVFFHDLMHDGEPLKDGSPPKWLFRTEIIFERDPSTAPHLTNQEKEAKECLANAEQLEEAGELTEAIKLYKRAYRLDPRLEDQQLNH